MAPTVAYIGLGNIGTGMATNLVTKADISSPLLVYNRTHARAVSLATDLPAGRAEAVSSLEDVVTQAEILFMCISHDEHNIALFDTMLATPGGVPGKVFVNCSSVTPGTSTQLAEMASKAGAEFVACPVFGVATVALAGQLIVAPSGPAPSVTRIQPFLAGVTARHVIDLSDSPPAQASLLKLISSSVILNILEAVAEALVLAEKSGLGTGPMRELAETLWPGSIGFYAGRMAGGGWGDGKPMARAEDAVGQFGHIMELARESGCRISATEVAGRHVLRVKEVQGSEGDIAGVYGAVREESGLGFGVVKKG